MRTFLGQVVDNIDPTKHGRIKAVIKGLNDGIETKHLEWIDQGSVRLQNQHSLPALDEWVEINFAENNTTWSHIDLKTKELFTTLGDDYLKSIVVVHRNLKQLGSEQGEFGILWTETDGFKIIKNKSFVNIDAKGNIAFDNSKKQISIVDDVINLGTATGSAEPGVLGDQNKSSLDQLNSTDKELFEQLNQGLNTLATTASANPYTAALGPVITSIVTSMTTIITKNYQANTKQIAKTLSKIVKLD